MKARTIKVRPSAYPSLGARVRVVRRYAHDIRGAARYGVLAGRRPQNGGWLVDHCNGWRLGWMHYEIEPVSRWQWFWRWLG